MDPIPPIAAATADRPLSRLHRYDQLTNKSPLSELPVRFMEVDGAEPGHRLDELFHANPDIPGLVVVADGQFQGLLSRRRYLERASRRFNRDIYFRRPVLELLELLRVETLRLSSTDLIELAATVVLLRAAEEVFEPIVVSYPDGRNGILDIQELLLAQTRIMESTNRENMVLLEQVRTSRRQQDLLLEEQRQIQARMAEDIAARQRAEQQQLANNRRLVRQTSALHEIAKLESVRQSDFDRAIVDIADTVRKTLRVDRTAVWLFHHNEQGSDLVEVATHDTSPPVTATVPRILPTALLPRYLSAILRDRILVVADVEEDVRIEELMEPVLQPLEITSLLHVCIQVEQRQIGIMRCEHRGERRPWTNDEMNFIEAAVNFIALMSIGQERNRAVRAREDSEARLERIIENSPVGICLIDAAGTILKANSSLSEFFKKQQGELVGTALPPHYADPGQHRQFLATFYREGWLRAVEVAFRGDGDGLRWTIMSWEPAQLGGRDVIVVWLFEVTAQKEAEEKLRQAKEQAEATTRAKSTFLATMSHEIRTPMNGILGMLELVKRTSLSREQQRFLSVIEESALALLRIIDDILDFSKIEAGRLDIESVPMSVQEVVEGVAHTMAPSARRKQLRLLCDVDPTVPDQLLGDPVRLRQILFNLVGNAIKFTQRGHVAVRATLVRRAGASHTLRFTVEDTGIGLSEQQIQRLFEPFAQADSSTSRKFGGTGLGLSICRMLAKLMDGRIGVDSAPGQGSTFWVELTLPLSAHLPSLPGDMPTRLDGIGVMVCLRHADEVAIVQRYLEADGATVEILTPTVAGSRWASPDPERRQRIAAGVTGTRETVVVLESETQDETFADLPRVLLHSSEKPPRRVHLNRRIAQAAGRTSADLIPDPITDPGAGLTAPRDPILVVDDHPINREVIERQLRQLGCTTVAAASGREALDAMDICRFSLILTDCEMPGMDGLELAQAIRRREREQGVQFPVPILALTANAMGGQAERCMSAGMNDCLIKPIDTVRLGQSIRRWLPEDGAPGAHDQRLAAATAGPVLEEMMPGHARPHPGDMPAEPDDAIAATATATVEAEAAPQAAAPVEAGTETVTEEAAKETSPAIELRGLRELVGDDRDALQALLGRYVQTTTPAVTALLSERSAPDDPQRAERVRSHAHKVKGASGMVGATRMFAACATLEQAATEGQAVRFVTLMDTVETEWAEVIRFIETL